MNFNTFTFKDSFYENLPISIINGTDLHSLLNPVIFFASKNNHRLNTI